MIDEIQVDRNHVGVALLVTNDYNHSNQKELDFVRKNADNLARLMENRFAYRTYVKSNVSRKDFGFLCAQLSTHEYDTDTCRRILVYVSGPTRKDAFVFYNQKKKKEEKITIDTVISLFKPDIGKKKNLEKIVRMFFFDSVQAEFCVSKARTAPSGAAPRVSFEANIFMAYGFSVEPYAFEDTWTYHLIQALENTEGDIYDTFTAVHRSVKATCKDELLTPSFTSRGLKEIVCFGKEAYTRMLKLNENDTSLSLSEPLQLDCDSAFLAGDKIPSLNNLETARMDLEDSKQDLEDEMLAKTLDSLQNIKKLTEVVDLKEEISRSAYGAVKKVSLYGTPCTAKDVHAILIDYTDQKELKAIKIKYLNECINCSKLLHPNIVQFLGIHYPSEDAQLPWLVMEKMDCDLTSFLVNHSQSNVSVNAKLSIIHDVSLGLKYLHAQDFIHRDLSSNNILLAKHLTAKIADLGATKLLDPDNPKTQTLAPGTLHFLPPEATCANPQYGKPVDVFSLGCVMIHLITHDWPDTGTCDNATLSEVEKRKPYLDRIQEPRELKDLIIGCLLDDPKHRLTIDTVVSKVEKLKTAHLASSFHHHSDTSLDH